MLEELSKEYAEDINSLATKLNTLGKMVKKDNQKLMAFHHFDRMLLAQTELGSTCNWLEALQCTGKIVQAASACLTAINPYQCIVDFLTNEGPQAIECIKCICQVTTIC